MDTKQVFSQYGSTGGDRPSKARYCPRCGTACVTKDVAGKSRAVCPCCGFIEFLNPSPVIAVLVRNDDSILLGRRSGGSFKAGAWSLPCGYIEFDEDFLSAAIREAREETGLDIELESIVNVAYNYLSPKIHSLAVVLLARPIGGTLCAGDDFDEVRWIPLSAPLPPLAFESDDYVIGRLRKGDLGGIAVDSRFSRRKDPAPASARSTGSTEGF
ncbi:MAG: NUDIX domain-containing protein [Bacillota bacterium]